MIKKSRVETYELKIKESKKIGDISITNNGGGHKILESGDVPFAEIKVKSTNKSDTMTVYSSNQKLWNEYLIDVEEVGWDGIFIRFSVKYVGKPKISQDQALDRVDKYCKSNLKLSQKDMFEVISSLSDNGGYYSVCVYSAPESKKNLSVSFKVDKFTGKIKKV
jgi:hypothetical protein